MNNNKELKLTGPEWSKYFFSMKILSFQGFESEDCFKKNKYTKEEFISRLLSCEITFDMENSRQNAAKIKKFLLNLGAGFKNMPKNWKSK